MPEPHDVCLLQCTGYEPDALLQKLRDVLAPLGGMSAFVRTGQRVLIKPNLLTDRAPEAAVTTHPELVRAVIRLVREAGGEVMVGDSPAAVSKMDRVWEKSGLGAVCETEGAAIVSFERSGAAEFQTDGQSYAISRAVLDAEVVINMPKVKTHVLTVLTAAVKNLYGTVPGSLKATLHRDCPKPRAFGQLLAAIAQHVNPALTIADGIVAMDGDGPSGGSPYPLHLLGASRSPLAMDLALCRVLKIPLGAVPCLAPLCEPETPEERSRAITYPVMQPEDFSSSGFRVPGTLRARLIPGRLVRLLSRFLWIRPAFSDRCVRCGQCLRACPVQALTLPEGADRPVLLASRCIDCCCCHEICPHRAVTMQTSPLIALLNGRRNL